jgi:PFU (PLAA family ubiquitin binding)/PUL domain
MIPKAYIWKGGKWEYIGEVMAQAGQPAKKHYPGDKFFPAGEYDYVFDVDYNEGAPAAKLPYNLGDNTLVAAERFLTREGLRQDYKQQIMDFIKTNTAGAKIPPKPAASVNQPVGSGSVKVFPMRESVFYDQLNLDPMLKKLEEVRVKYWETHHASSLLEHEGKYIASLVAKLRDPAIYSYIKEFSSFEIEVAKKLTKFLPEDYVAVMDFWRCLVLHHASQVFFSGVDSGMPLFAALVGKLKSGPPVLWVLFFKFLSNLFKHTSNSMGLLRSKDIIGEAFRSMNKSDGKVLVVAANYLLNCSSNIDGLPGVPADFVQSQVKFILELAQAGPLDAESLIKLSISVGNFDDFAPNLPETIEAIKILLPNLKTQNDEISKTITKAFEDKLTSAN